MDDIYDGKLHIQEYSGNKLTNRNEAAEAGDFLYRDFDGCKICSPDSSCGVDRYVENNECWECLRQQLFNDRDPKWMGSRSMAIMHRHEFFYPMLASCCPKKPHQLKQRTKPLMGEMSCTTCQEIKNTERGLTHKDDTLDSVMMRTHPDIVISKKDAKLMGIKVYRTGKPCKSDHCGFRYVSTGCCITCKKEN